MTDLDTLAKNYTCNVDYNNNVTSAGTAIAGDKEARLKSLNLLIAAQAEIAWNIEREFCQELKTTGMTRIDANLHYNNLRCSKCGIELRSLGGKTPTALTESQLETLIANLLDNAINSHKNSFFEEQQEKYITSHLWEDGLKVEDNGAAFCESVLADLVRCKETLTPNRGNGVGIGYVTIFEITNEYSASVEVMQDNENKSVTVLFDRKNRLVIKK
jgi:hypothetical protein